MAYLLSKLKKIKNKQQFLDKHCADVAQAIQQTHGGDIYIVGDFPSQKFWHAVVKRNGKFWDITGPHTKKQLTKKYPRQTIKKATQNDLTALRKYQRNRKDAIKQLKKQLKK